MLGLRHTGGEVFVLKSPASTRCSGRIKSREEAHKWQLETWTARNGKGDKLAAAQARLLWNALDSESASASVNVLKERLRHGTVMVKLLKKDVLNDLSDS